MASAETLVAEINALQAGHTDRRDEDRIIDILRSADAGTLNVILASLDLDKLLSDVDDRLLGPDHRTELLGLLGGERAGELSVKNRAALAHALQTGRTDKAAERAVRGLLLSASGEELTSLKKAIDAGGDYHDLQKLIFEDVDDSGIRGEILAHIASASPARTEGRVKVVSDVDDTFYSTVNDDRYPGSTTYPGVLQFYKELEAGPGSRPPSGDLAFLTARPKVPGGAIEGLTHETLSSRGVPTAVILSGDFAHVHSHEAMAKKKYENFVQYRALFPEYAFVWIGDSGQGDAPFGVRILGEFPEEVKGVFIHDIGNLDDAGRRDWEAKGVKLFRTYAGAAARAFEMGLLGPEGLKRVVEATKRDLQAVDFGNNNEMRAEREADLARDAQTAEGLLAG